MITKEAIAALVEPLLADGETELVQIQLVPGRKQLQIKVFIDRPDGVSVEDCAALSRQISRRLDAGPELMGPYRLEVSSAGMNRPIWSLDHFRRFRGERVRVELREPRDGKVRFEGSIESVEGEVIHLRTREGELLEVRAGDLVTARLDLDPWKGRR